MGDLYVVTMYRWGNTSNHSYLKGIFDDIALAVSNAESEKYHRGGKYEYEIRKVPLNKSKLGTIGDIISSTCTYEWELPILKGEQ